MFYKNVTEIIGNTPILQLNILKQALNLKANVYAKLEFFNPAGSIKDRVALNIVTELEKQGALKQGATVIEATSGNMGIALAKVCKDYDNKVIILINNIYAIKH